MPPDATATAQLVPAGNLPSSAAAIATAPPGSTTIFRCLKAVAMTLSTRSSLTANPPDSVLRLIEKVISPGLGVTTASQIDLLAGSTDRISPLSSDRMVSSNPSGSAAHTFAPGICEVTARLVPAISPPPPQQLMT